jgi:acetyl esterase
MNLAPQVQQFLDASPTEPLDHLTLTERRELMRNISDANFLRSSRRAGAVASVTQYMVPVAGGEIVVRAYRPSRRAPLPAHILLHGGGWWMGSVFERVNDAIARHRCVHADCAVFAVQYRLAPEHPFPAAIADVYATLRWLSGEAAGLGIDAGNISIGGTSAGGNLAAAVALRARDEGGPDLVFQLLEVPSLDLTGETLRKALTGDELRPLGRYIADFDDIVRRYLDDDPGLASNPLASPLRADDLSGLPPAHVMTAELDPLRVEGEAYARRLVSAAVAATAARHSGAVHATGFLTRVWEPARKWEREAALVLRQAHQQAPPDTGASASDLPGNSADRPPLQKERRVQIRRGEQCDHL